MNQVKHNIKLSWLGGTWPGSLLAKELVQAIGESDLREILFERLIWTAGMFSSPWMDHAQYNISLRNH